MLHYKKKKNQIFFNLVCCDECILLFIYYWLQVQLQFSVHCAVYN